MQYHSSWQHIIEPEMNKNYFKKIIKFLNNEIVNGKIIFPKTELLFDAFNKTAFDNIKVVIIGQDPYHGINQANGMAFSVSDNVAIPPSLKNIFKEINLDLHFSIPSSGNLSNWAKQGILLLNSCLSVEASKPMSHSKICWQLFTDTIIEKINLDKKGIIFLLWGKNAQTKKTIINTQKHFILEAPHPSPLSAHKGFIGCKHFSKCNSILINQNKKPIIWGDI